MNRLNLSLLIFLCSLHLFSQTNEYPQDFVSIEFLGKGKQFISISFERVVCCNVSIGFGLGFNNFSDKSYNTLINNVLTERNIKELDLFIPLYSHLQFGNDKHKLLINYGVNLQTQLLNEFYLEHSRDFVIKIIPFAGFGYEYARPKIKYRIQAYFNFIQGENIFPDISPWAGISLAIPLKF